MKREIKHELIGTLFVLGKTERLKHILYYGRG